MTPTAARVTGISNLIIAVADMGRSIAFYRDVVGLPVRLAVGEIAFLQAGAVTLCLRQVAGLPPVDDERRVEIVFDVADIHPAFEALRSRGAGFRVEPRVVTGNLWAADFRDPDGHVLSIFGPAAAETPS